MDRLLFLNTYSPDEDETLAQKNALEKSLSDLHLPERVKKVIETLPIEKAVESYTIGDKKIIRRPELFICLMTGRLQRLTGMDKSDREKVGIALGLEEKVWKSKLENYLESGWNTRQALIFMYAEKIELIRLSQI